MRSPRALLSGFVCATTLIIAGCSGGATDSAPQLSLPIATTLRPTPDGFSFPNFPASASSVEFGDTDLFAMFGSGACVDGVETPCVATAEASAWARMVNQARVSGHCLGLVAEAADRFDLRLSPPTFELKNDSTVTADIIQRFATQFLPEVQDERDEWAKKSLREIVNALGEAFKTGTTPYVLGVYSPRGGHAVLPYAVEFESPDIAIVRVYDSNWPGKNRFVRMNLATDEWTFSFSGPDPDTDLKPWSGKSGDIDLGSNKTRNASKCPFCSTDGKVLNSFILIRAGDNDWSVTANGVDYNQNSATVDGVVQVRPVINGYLDSAHASQNIRDFVVMMSDNQNFTVNLKSVGSAFIVQPSSISQVTNSGTESVVVSVADEVIETTGGDTVVTVASSNVVVSASGGASAVTINEGEITATVSTPSGQSATVTASAATPQALVQVARSETGPAIVVTTRNRSDEVQVTEISSSGSTTMRASLEVLNLNATKAVLPDSLQVVTVKDQLPPASERSTLNPNYTVDVQFVSAAVEVVSRDEPLTAAAVTTSETTVSTTALTTSTTATTSTTSTSTTTTIVPRRTTTTTTTTSSTTVPATTTTSTSTTTTSSTTTTTSSTTTTTSSTTVPATTTTSTSTSTSTTTTTIGPVSRSISIDAASYVSSYNSNATPPNLTSTASAGSGTKTYSSTTASVCTINASTGVVTFVGPGACTLQVAIASDGTYVSATSSTISFTVLTLRTIAIDTSSYYSSYGIGDTPPTLTSTASVGSGTKTYSSTTAPVCTIGSSTGVVAFVTAGTCTLRVAIASDGAYDSATSSLISFSILSSRTIAIDSGSYSASYNRYATAPTLTSTASAGSGTKTYSSTTASVCTINSSTGVVSFVSAGTCTLRVVIASDGTYVSATSSTISLTVTYAIGDIGPGGGKIFMTLSTGGNTTGKYFESAPSSWSGGVDPTANWCNITNGEVGTSAQGTTIGTGQGNSTAIGSYCTTGAAVTARAYRGGGLNDWFLPSEDELEALQAVKTTIGGFESASYWSSSEIAAGRSGAFAGPTREAYPVHFPTGGSNLWYKYQTYHVRPIRMFEPIG